MKTARSPLAFIGSLILLTGSSAFAANPVAMYVGRAINVTPAQSQAVAAVCAIEYAKASGSTVIEPEKAQAAFTPAASVVDVAQALNAQEVVELNLVSLATDDQPGRLMVNAVRRDARGSELFHADLTAASLDDAVPVCQRLSEALVHKSDPVSLVDRHSVTSFEATASAQPNRLGPEAILGVKTIFAMPLASTGVNPIGGVAFDARFEFERFFFEVGGGILIPAVVSSSNATYGGLTSEIGASYYLAETDTAPYVGGGLQPRIVFSGSVFNLAPYAQVGVMFSRKSSTRFYVDARVSQNLLPVTSTYGLSGGSVYPTELALQLGIGW